MKAGTTAFRLLYAFPTREAAEATAGCFAFPATNASEGIPAIKETLARDDRIRATPKTVWPSSTQPQSSCT